jgi:7-cyano-7-deazaguanine synthase
MPGDAVILLSGGMDSGVLLAWSRQRYRDIHALSFDYGSKHAAKELAMAQVLAKTYHARFVKVSLPFMDELFSSSLLKSGAAIPEGSYAQANMLSTVVPFRNGIMLSIAVGYAENLKIPSVLIAAHAGDHPVYPDCRKSFMEAMDQAARLGTYAGVMVEAPFISMSKAAIAEQGRTLNFDFLQTWSCYKGGDIHCGVCATCLERKNALGYAQGLDPTRYKE